MTMSWALEALALNPESWPAIWIDLTCKSSFLLALAGVTGLVLKGRSAAARHAVWTLAFLGLLLLPLCSLALPTWRINIAAQAGPAPPVQAFLFTKSFEPAQNTPSGSLEKLQNNQSSPAAANPLTFAEGPNQTLSRVSASFEDFWSPALLIWMVGCAIGILPLMGGYLHLHYLRLSSRRPEGPRIALIAQSLASQLGIRREIVLLFSGRSCMPMTWGLRRPVVLLPLAAEHWSVSRLRAVLVHELAHVQRFDAFTQMMVQVVRSLYWYNPFVWIACRQIRLEQETSCDDIVLNAGLDAQQYAAQLLSITAGLPAHLLVSSVALAMAKKHTLERRLLAILDSARDRRTPKRPVLACALTALVAALALLGPMRLLVGQPATARAAGSIVSLDSLAQGLDQQTLARTLDEVRAKIQAMAVDAPAERVLLEGALRGMIEAMHDPYSSYLPASDATPLDPSQASMVGIGIQIRQSDQGIAVISPLPDSPARKAGLKSGDLILAINGKSTNEMPLHDAVNFIRGPAKSAVELKVRSQGIDRELSLIRAPVSIPSVHGIRRNPDDTWNYVIDAAARIGYIQIVTFNGGTVREFQQALEELDQAGVKGLVLDLRFCPGGLLNATVGVAQMLLDRGDIVSIKYRDLHEERVQAEGNARFGQRPIVVLVNEQTASGGEILAGALKQNNRAVVLGARTHGKGSLQSIVNLNGEKGAIKLTTGQLYLPGGRMIQKAPNATEWGVDPSDGFYMPLTAKQVIALEERLRQRQVLDEQPAVALQPSQDPADPQLAGALKAMTAKLTHGEFERVGRPISEFAAHQQALQAERLKLKKQLAEIERELEVLGAKEPKNS
jgi:carboxyl-terminal processing protease